MVDLHPRPQVYRSNLNYGLRRRHYSILNMETRRGGWHTGCANAGIILRCFHKLKTANDGNLARPRLGHARVVLALESINNPEEF